MKVKLKNYYGGEELKKEYAKNKKIEQYKELLAKLEGESNE